MPPAFHPPHRCRNCGEPLTAPPGKSLDRRKKYCDEACRKQFGRTVNKAAAAGLGDVKPGMARDRSQAVTPYVKAARSLAFEGMEDEIRDTLRAEVRDQVRQHLKDNILGGVEALTALLPEVLVRLGEDVEHPDWMRSSRAQSLILKYVFMFKDTEAADGDSKTINIYHGVPVPDTPLGDAMKKVADKHLQDVIDGEVVQLPGHLIDPDLPDDEIVELPREAFEQFYPQCVDCGDIKPPDTFAKLHDTDDMKGLCRSCDYQRNVKRGFKRKDKTTSKEVLPEGPRSLIEQDE